MREPGTRLVCGYEGSECCVHVPLCTRVAERLSQFFFVQHTVVYIWKSIDAMNLKFCVDVGLWYECKTGFEFVMPKTYLFLFDIITIATNSKPLFEQSSSILPQFCSDSACYLVCQRQLCASSKVNLLNDDPYRC